MTIFLLFQILIDSQRDLLSLDTLQTLLRYFTVGVAVVMVAVPEGLPLAISISMAFSIDTMKKDNLLIKKPEAPENLGYIREICTGKTATLTENKMTVNQFYAGGRTYDNKPNADGERPLLLNNESRIHPNIVNVLKDSIIFNNDSRIEMDENGYYVPTGNGTEVAMLRFLQQNEIPAQELLVRRFREGEHECSIPFNSIRKRATTVIRPFKKCNYVRVIVKGAPEYVLPLCTSTLTEDGETRTLGLDEGE
jgi:magnesium-transporting ATPase (P-type)